MGGEIGLIGRFEALFAPEEPVHHRFQRYAAIKPRGSRIIVRLRLGLRDGLKDFGEFAFEKKELRHCADIRADLVAFV